MVRQKLHPRLGTFAVGDVDGNADVVRNFFLAARFAHCRDHQPGRVSLTIALAQQHLALPLVAFLDGAGHVRHHSGFHRIGQIACCVVRLMAQQATQMLAHHLVKVVRRGAAVGAVDAEHPLLAVHDDDAFAGGLKHLGPQLHALLHDFQHVDGGEGGQHRVLPLKAQPPCRQHRPRRLGAAEPAHLELVNLLAVRELLKKPRAHTRLQPFEPGVGGAVTQPGPGRLVGVQHPMLGNGGDHHRHRDRFQQFGLRPCGTRAGGQLFTGAAVLVQLRQHAVEGLHQVTDFILAGPLRTQVVVAALAHIVGHTGQLLQRLGNQPRHGVHHTQNGQQQRQRRAQMQPHLVKQRADAGLQQVVQRL